MLYNVKNLANYEQIIELQEQPNLDKIFKIPAYGNVKLEMNSQEFNYVTKNYGEKIIIVPSGNKV